MSIRGSALRGAPLLGALIAVPAILIPTRFPGSSPGTPKLAEQRPAIVEIREIEPGSLNAVAFELDRAGTVEIQATGADRETVRRIAGRSNLIGRLVFSLVKREPGFEDEVWAGNAWILDANTREVVWELRETGRDRARDGLIRYGGQIALPAGAYEAYYSFFPTEWYSGHEGWRWLGRDDERAYGDIGLRISGTGRRIGPVRPPAEASPGTVVAFHHLGDDAYERLGFSLAHPTEVDIRAIGEARRSTSFDYGWVINMDTRARVWEFSYDESEAAGGDEKNRVSRTRLTLPAGRYAAFFVTDDSHSPGAWNSPPPHDPFRYGLEIRVVDPEAASGVRTFAYAPVPRENAIVALTGVGDDEYRSQGFSLKRALGVRIFALAEGRDGDLVDRAWITNATTGGIVWDMQNVQTEHAGGAQKNRLFDGVIRLEPGNYLVHYATDDSHAAGNWNDVAPADREYWGVTLLPASGTLSRDIIQPYDPNNDPAIVARLVGIRDSQVSRRRFTLEQDGAVRVYALGEGMNGEMFDYAWIIDARTGRRVWEMRYADTEHAGGANKNRVFDGAIRLAAGEYELVYRTDDSHAFGDWNSTPPHDFTNWGVSLYRVR